MTGVQGAVGRNADDGLSRTARYACRKGVEGRVGDGYVGALVEQCRLGKADEAFFGWNQYLGFLIAVGDRQ